MAADPSVVVDVGGNASGLVKALDAAKAGVNKFADDAGKVLERKLGLRDVFKGVMQGIGIGGVQQIADQLVKPFKESADAAANIANETERAANATLNLIKLRQTDVQQLEVLRKEAQRLADEMQRPVVRVAEWKVGLAAVLSQFGMTTVATKLLITEEDKRAKAAKATADLAANALEQAQLQKKVDEDVLKMEQERWDLAKANRRENELLAKQKIGTILPAERDELKLIQLQNKEKQVQIELTYLLAKPLKDWTEEDKKRFAVLQLQTAEIAKQIGLILNPPIPPKPPIVKVIEGYIEMWDKFVANVTRTGRGDTELSDRELERKKANIQKDLFNMERAGRETGAYQGGDYFQKMELNAVNQELALRQKVRSYTASFGEEKAFQLSGVSEQRFAEINQTNTKLDESNNLLRDIKRRLDGGILTLPTNVVKGGG